jgi:hypothetical protein
MLLPGIKPVPEGIKNFMPLLTNQIFLCRQNSVSVDTDIVFNRMSAYELGKLIPSVAEPVEPQLFAGVGAQVFWPCKFK